MYMDLTDMISGGTEEQQIPEQKLTKEEYAAKKQKEREEVWAEVDSQAQGVFQDGEKLKGFLDFMAECNTQRTPNLLLIYGQHILPWSISVQESAVLPFHLKSCLLIPYTLPACRFHSLTCLPALSGIFPSVRPFTFLFLLLADISEFFPHRWFFILFFPASFPTGRNIFVARERFGRRLLSCRKAR